jgi:biotin transport system substrate-specific component
VSHNSQASPEGNQRMYAEETTAPTEAEVPGTPGKAAGLLPRDLALIALFAALTAAMGFVDIPVAGLPTPVVLQNLAVFLAGSVLGPKRGFLSVLTFLVLALAGLPILSGGTGGVGAFATANLGYLIGWPIGAFIIGVLAYRRRRASKAYYWQVLIANLIGGVIFIDLLGEVVSTAFTGLSFGHTFIASLIFIPGDVVKAFVAAFVAAGVQRAYPLPDAGVRRGEER